MGSGLADNLQSATNRARCKLVHLRARFLALEGTFAGLTGIFAWFHLPSNPDTTAGWFRGRQG